MDDDFIIFFIRHTGYVLTSCSCGWKKVREELANPNHDIDPGSFKYELSGLPVPAVEGVSIKAVWELMREKIQASWSVYKGRKTMLEVYNERP